MQSFTSVQWTGMLVVKHCERVSNAELVVGLTECCVLHLVRIRSKAKPVVWCMQMCNHERAIPEAGVGGHGLSRGCMCHRQSQLGETMLAAEASLLGATTNNRMESERMFR